MKNFTLTNGNEIPAIGFGTWMIPNDIAAEKVKEAISIGYRHIDTAQAYENEEGVGEGIRLSGIPREELFVTTKLAAEIKDFEEARMAIDESLKKLNMDYVDLMIIHSPKPWSDFQGDSHFFEGNLAAWKALEEAHNSGKIKAIGVSNFEVIDLENLIEKATIKPMVNQILAHIGQTPFDVIAYSQQNDLLVEAYSPIAHGEMLKNKEITEMATKYQVSIAQLAIRYCLQLGLLPLPKTESVSHMRDNLAVDFEITEDDMKVLTAVPPFDYGENKEIPVFKKVSIK